MRKWKIVLENNSLTQKGVKVIIEESGHFVSKSTICRIFKDAGIKRKRSKLKLACLLHHWKNKGMFQKF